MIQFFCGIDQSQMLRFPRESDRLVCSHVCVPSFANTGTYALHSFVRRFYDAFKPAVAPPATRKICLSRRNFETSTRGVWRVFELREAFEALATDHGYDIAYPEGLTFAEQITLFQSAECLIGEHGSGMHGVIFSARGTTVACFPMSNAIQFRIGALSGHTNIYLNRFTSWRDDRGVFHYTTAEKDLTDMMTIVDRERRVPRRPRIRNS